MSGSRGCAVRALLLCRPAHLGSVHGRAAAREVERVAAAATLCAGEDGQPGSRLHHTGVLLAVCMMAYKVHASGAGHTLVPTCTRVAQTCACHLRRRYSSARNADSGEWCAAGPVQLLSHPVMARNISQFHSAMQMLVGTILPQVNAHAPTSAHVCAPVTLCQTGDHARGG